METKEKKVLVASPIYDGMRYCWDKFLDSITNLSYSSYNILIVDNSKSNDFFNEISSNKQIKVIKDTFDGPNTEKVVSSRNIIFEYAKENNYDYVLMMDADVIPPPDIIEDLLTCNKSIVSGLYFNYFKSSGKLKILPVAWAFVTPEEFEKMKKVTDFPPMVKSHLDIRRHLIEEEFKSRKLFKVMYPSAGCMLISKKVFEKISYGLLKVPNGLVTGDDIYFINKARELGFDSYCYTKVLCDHLLAGKFEKGAGDSLLHPMYKK